MVIGDPTTFALESFIGKAYKSQSLCALGYFLIHIGGHCYGVKKNDATFLGCSIDEVKNRIGRRGMHSASFAINSDAREIADAFCNAVYGGDERDYFGIPCIQFCELIYSNDLMWAPDGDEAFDDGSKVLQFDVGDLVRLIGFRCNDDFLHDEQTLSEFWLLASDFYEILRRWVAAFEVEWEALPKISSD